MRRGDLVEVTGVFNAACPLHGGDLDIHAASLRIFRPGCSPARLIRPSRVITAAVLVVLTIALLAAWALTRRRSGGDGRPPG